MYERRFGLALNCTQIVSLSLNKSVKYFNKYNSTKSDSDICVKNNGHNISRFVRHRAQKHVPSLGGEIELGERIYDVKKEPEIFYSHVMV